MKKIVKNLLVKVLMVTILLQSVLVGVIKIPTVQASVINYIVNESFEGSEWQVGRDFFDAGYTKPTAYTYARGTTDAYMKVINVGGVKALEMYQPNPTSGTPATTFRKTYDFTSDFTVEAKVAVIRGGTSQRRILTHGKVGTTSHWSMGPSSTVTGISVTNQHHFPNGTSPGTTLSMPAPTWPSGAVDGDMSNWYEYKMNWRKNANGRFIYDLYTKKDSTVTTWQFAGTVYPEITANLYDKVTNIDLDVMGLNGGVQPAKMYVDHFKIYEVSPTNVTSSTVTNNQTSVSTSTTSIGITFNQNMDAATLNSTNIALYDEGTGSNIAYTGSYDSGTKTYSIDTTGKLALNGEYSIKFTSANIKNTDGFALESTSDIRFTTASVFGFSTTSSIANGATSVNIDTGVATLTFAKSINQATLNSTNILLTDASDNAIPGGYVVEADATDNTKCKVYFGQLAYNTSYKLRVTSNVAAQDATYASPKTFVFTTASSLLDVNFEDNAKWPVGGSVTDTTLSYYPANPSAQTTGEYETGSSGNKVLKVNVPSTGTPVTHSKSSLNLTGAFSTEIYFKPSNFTTAGGNNILALIGKKADGTTDTYQNGFLITTTNIGMTDAITGSKTIVSNYDKNKYYGLKVVAYKNESGFYLVDAYLDDSGIIGNNQWTLKHTGIQAATTANSLSKVTSIQLLISKGASAGNDNTAYFDNFKISQEVAPKVTYSTIKQSSTVSPSTSSIDVKFSVAMNAATVTNSNIALVRNSDSHIVATTGSYNAATRTYTMTLTEALDKGVNYTVTFGSALKSQSNMSMQSGSNIAFSTWEADVSVEGAIELTETANSNDSYTNLTGKSTAYAKLTLKKNISNNTDVVILVVLYDANNTLQNIAVQNKTLSQATTIINDVGLTGITPQTGWKVKVLVWDSLSTMQPIAKNILEVAAQ